MWFERYGFRFDPYTIKDPFQIPVEFLEWNREDIQDAAWKFQTFVDRAVGGYRVGLGVYGPVGSGKTWLLRIIEKTFREKLGEKVLFLYIRTYLPASEPTFGTVYSLFIGSILDQIDVILSGLTRAIAKKMKKRGQEIEPLKELIGEEGWRRLIGDIVPDRSLANCLWHLTYHPDKKDLCREWLRGEKLSAKDLSSLEFTMNLDKDFRKIEALKNLILLGLNVYSLVVLVVDEMENARPMVARIIGDSLRDLLDSFSGNFSVICSYTAERADELVDLGYGPWLHTRLEYFAGLEALATDYVAAWLAKHNQLYREKTWKGEDQLLPFTKEGMNLLLRMMRPEARYPRYIFVNCGHLGQAAYEADKNVIDPTFIEANRDKLSDLASQATLT